MAQQRRNRTESREGSGWPRSESRRSAQWRHQPAEDERGRSSSWRPFDEQGERQRDPYRGTEDRQYPGGGGYGEPYPREEWGQSRDYGRGPDYPGSHAQRYGRNRGYATRYDWSAPDEGGQYGGGYGSAYDNPQYGSGYGGRDPRGLWARASDEVASWLGDEDAERRREMDQHRGRGPKNYTRTDERIREDVCDRLSDDPAVDASEIEVAVSDGEVTLSGSVASRDQRRRAEDCAESVSGVKQLQNSLRVEPQSSVHSGATMGSTSSTASSTASKSKG